MKSLRNVLIIYERVHCYAKRQLKRRDIIKAGEKSTNRNIESVHRADVVDTSKKTQQQPGERRRTVHPTVLLRNGAVTPCFRECVNYAVRLSGGSVGVP